MKYLCDEGKRMFAEYLRQEKLMSEMIKNATEPMELSEEFYQAAEDYVIHTDNCESCVE